MKLIATSVKGKNNVPTKESIEKDVAKLQAGECFMDSAGGKSVKCKVTDRFLILCNRKEDKPPEEDSLTDASLTRIAMFRYENTESKIYKNVFVYKVHCKK